MTIGQGVTLPMYAHDVHGLIEKACDIVAELLRLYTFVQAKEPEFGRVLLL